VTSDTTDITGVDDLAGKTVGAQDGTTGEEYANDETDADQVRGFPEGPDAFNALRNGQVDAVIIDQPVVIDALEGQGGGDLTEVAEIPTGELYGLAIGQDSDALREEVNSALQELKDDGTLEDLYATYFPGVEVPDTVLEGTNEPE
jgi:polar amino acid transport system substrate-binding protein